MEGKQYILKNPVNKNEPFWHEHSDRKVNPCDIGNLECRSHKLYHGINFSDWMQVYSSHMLSLIYIQELFENQSSLKKNIQIKGIRKLGYREIT